MMNYREITLRDVIHFKNGKKRPASEGNIPVYGGNGVLGYAGESNYEHCIIIGRVGAYCGSVYLEEGKCWVSDNAIAAVPTGGNDIRFFYYLLKGLRLNERHIGTSQPLLTQEILNKINCEVPSYPEQQRIAELLGSLDRKINVNQKLNDNLYAQAKATTKQWISKSTGDYELLPLSDIASINPDTYSPKETWKYVNYLDTSSITEGCIAEIQHITPSSEKLPSRARRKIAPNDIVFSTVRPNQRHYGIINEPLPNMLGSTGFAVIRSKNPLVCNELIYLCLTENEFIEKMQQLAEQSTSTFPSIKPSDLGVCEIPCPKDQSSTSFTETLKSLFALIAANQRENISLSEIRDALLPKLMSGEIDVSDIQL